MAILMPSICTQYATVGLHLTVPGMRILQLNTLSYTTDTVTVTLTLYSNSVTLLTQTQYCNCKCNKLTLLVRPRLRDYDVSLKGLAQAEIIKKSVILFWLFNMTT